MLKISATSCTLMMPRVILKSELCRMTTMNAVAILKGRNWQLMRFLHLKRVKFRIFQDDDTSSMHCSLSNIWLVIAKSQLWFETLFDNRDRGRSWLRRRNGYCPPTGRWSDPHVHLHIAGVFFSKMLNPTLPLMFSSSVSHFRWKASAKRIHVKWMHLPYPPGEWSQARLSEAETDGDGLATCPRCTPPFPPRWKLGQV